MAKHDDGGPAFPFTPNEQRELQDGTWDQNGEPGDPGMSLWAWFAGQALAGLCAHPRTGKASDYELARFAEQQATAMIARMRRREKDSAGEAEEG